MVVVVFVVVVVGCGLWVVVVAMVVGDGSSSPDFLEEPKKCRFIFSKHRPRMNGKDTYQL